MKKRLALLIGLLAAMLPACSLAATPPAPTAAHTPFRISTPSPSPEATASPTPVPTTAPTAIPTAEPLPEATQEPVAEETAEPSPAPEYRIPDIKKAGLTDGEFRKINILLRGLAASGIYGKNAYTSAELLDYCYWVLSDPELARGSGIEFAREGAEDLPGYDESVDEETIPRIIKSALGIDYVSGYAGSETSGIRYLDDRYYYSLAEGEAGNSAHVYHIERLQTGNLRVRLNVAEQHCCDARFLGKVEAEIRKNKDSLFGYTILSNRVISGTPRFTKAAASSWLPDKGSSTYRPENAIDGRDETAWVCQPGSAQWITLSSSSAQAVTGLAFRFGDESQAEAVPGAVPPAYVKIEFSDGTSMVTETMCGYIPFGREIKTRYIKIIIAEDETGKPSKSGSYYFSEIEVN